MKMFYSKDLWKIKNPILIYGVGGGMGNVARLVAKALLKKFKYKKVATIVSGGFSDVVYANRNGILKNLELSLYHFKNRRRNFLVLYGLTQPNVQPTDIQERYKTVIKLLRLSKKLNTKEIISLGGFGVEIEPDNPKVIVASNNKKYLDSLIKKIRGIEIETYKNSNIVGMSGLIVSLARYYKINSAIFLAETYPTMGINGYIGAAKLIEVLNHLYNFNIDTKSYIEKGKKIKKKIMKDILKQKRFPEDQSKKKNLYYFG